MVSAVAYGMVGIMCTCGMALARHCTFRSQRGEQMLIKVTLSEDRFILLADELFSHHSLLLYLARLLSHPQSNTTKLPFQLCVHTFVSCY